MRYKLILMIITSVLFLTVCIGVFVGTFKVAKIQVNVECVEGSPENILEIANEVLKEYENKLSVDTVEVESKIRSASQYIDVIKIEKGNFNKITVDICERKECFAIKSDDEYYILDNKLYVLRISDVNENNIDGLSNILLEFPDSIFDNSNLRIGETIELNDQKTGIIMEKYSDFFLEAKQKLAGIQLITNEKSKRYSAMISMKEGVAFEINPYYDICDENLTKIKEYYENLEDKSTALYYADLDGSDVKFTKG